MSNHLPFKQIIITRPPGQAGALKAQLQDALGEAIQIHHLPLITISPLATEPLPPIPFTGAIFISGNAVSHFFDLDPTGAHGAKQLAQARAQARAKLANTSLFAVGEHTARQLEMASQRPVTFPQQMNAEGLLALAPLANVAGQNWLIVKGQGGRPLIKETLSQRGATVCELDVYCRKLPDYSLQRTICLHQSEQTVWIITSAEALDNLFRILGLGQNPDHRTSVIVSSDRLAELAVHKGFTIIAQSAGASETQLVQCVRTLSTR